jgi:hypothetical protein
LSRTFDSGATPKNVRSGDRRAPATMADIDLGELRKKMAITVEKAKQEDPKELQKEIARLRIELKRVPQGVDPELRQLREDKQKISASYYAELEKTLGKMKTQFQHGVKILLNMEWPGGKPVIEAGERAAELHTPATPLPDDPAFIHWDRFDRSIGARHMLEASVAKCPGDDTVGPSKRRILIALAQNPDGAEINRLAALAGYTVNGHFNNMLGSLRLNEYITPARTLPQITQAGLKALGDFEPLPRGEALREYWLQRVGRSKAKILKVLFDFYPKPLVIDELAEEAGYTVNGHFNNMMGSLRTMGLITPPRQPIKAMDYLFEE